jgi:hypothetical protein
MKMLDTLKRSIGRQNNRALAHLMGSMGGVARQEKKERPAGSRAFFKD